MIYTYLLLLIIYLINATIGIHMYTFKFTIFKKPIIYATKYINHNIMTVRD